jgi:hypothetical protein
MYIMMHVCLTYIIQDTTPCKEHIPPLPPPPLDPSPSSHSVLCDISHLLSHYSLCNKIVFSCIHTVRVADPQ